MFDEAEDDREEAIQMYVLFVLASVYSMLIVLPSAKSRGKGRPKKKRTAAGKSYRCMIHAHFPLPLLLPFSGASHSTY